MVNILLSGANGRMGRVIAEMAGNSSRYSITAGIDINCGSGTAYGSFPVFSALSEYRGGADVIVDFSHHSALEGLLAFAIREKLPIVVATTGHTPGEIEMMKAAAHAIPIFYSRNMSLGINLLMELVKKAAAALEGFDIEIVESHHRMKLDAPSGTALMLADAAASVFPADEKPAYVYDRTERREPRPANEIGIHSVRGGTIVGEHQVIFAGNHEVVTLSHSAESRAVFAEGALRAAAYLIGKPAGLYDMADLVNEIE